MTSRVKHDRLHPLLREPAMDPSILDLQPNRSLAESGGRALACGTPGVHKQRCSECLGPLGSMPSLRSWSFCA